MRVWNWGVWGEDTAEGNSRGWELPSVGNFVALVFEEGALLLSPHEALANNVRFLHGGEVCEMVTGAAPGSVSERVLLRPLFDGVRGILSR
jgi:hypothetical protein